MAVLIYEYYNIFKYMKYDLDELNEKFNKINYDKDILNEELKESIHHIADIDETNITRELKYDMYDGLERIYQIENDKYKDLISRYSQAYLEMSDFYVGEELPREDFKRNLLDIYLFMFYVLDTCNPMNEYDID